MNESTFATVKKMPFPLEKREVVFKMIWQSEVGKVLVAIASVDDKVDYGVSLRVTRGSSRGLWLIEDLPPRKGVKQCSATYVQVRRGAKRRAKNALLPFAPLRNSNSEIVNLHATETRRRRTNSDVGYE